MDLRKIYDPPKFSNDITYGLDEIEWALTKREVNLSPPYQRPLRWSLKQQSEFMGHLLSGGETLPIIIQRVPDGGPQEVLDGKQRLTAMLAWLHGEICAWVPNGPSVHIDDLERGQHGTTADAVHGLSLVSVRFKYINLPFEERKDFYIKLNSAGSPHTTEDIEHARNARENNE